MEKRKHDYSTKQGTIDAIKFECEQNGLTLPAQIAYVLATVEHETGGTFQPVTEAYWLDNADKYLKQHHGDYYPYYGRGFVQLTWDYNYKKYGEILGIDLIGNPSLALNPDVALFVLVHGFKNGTFTGKKITDYINADKCDFVRARKCINGLDKADHIAGLAKKYLKTLG